MDQLPSEHQPSRVRHWLSVSLAFLVVTGSLSFLFLYLIPNIPRFFPASLSPTVPDRTVTIPLPGYQAPIPGELCDTGQLGLWSVGSSHFDYEKEQAVPDPYTELECQPDGLLVSRTQASEFYGIVYFDGMRSTGSTLGEADSTYKFPRHYRVQIDATIQSTREDASIALFVRNQESSPGAYSVSVNPNGVWRVGRHNERDGAMEKQLALGFLKQPAKKFTLIAEVHSSIMSFTLNGMLVATVKGEVYPETFSVGFGIADAGAKEPPSALFSNFQYTELPSDLPLNTSSIQMSLLESAKEKPYEAKIPGFGCDPGGGQWSPPSFSPEQTLRLSCQPNGLRMSTGKGSKYLGEELFYWYDGNFPPNYRVSVQIATNQLNGGCSGVLTHVPSTGDGGYAYYICQNGYWVIQRFDEEGRELASGFVNEQSTYHVEITEQKEQHRFIINGAQVASLSEKTYTEETNHIALLISTPNDGGSADFSQFVFTPLK